MDRLIVACAFDCGVIPLGYREQRVRIPHVTAVGGQLWLLGHEQDERSTIMVTLVDEGMRWSPRGVRRRTAGQKDAADDYDPQKAD